MTSDQDLAQQAKERGYRLVPEDRIKTLTAELSVLPVMPASQVARVLAQGLGRQLPLRHTVFEQPGGRRLYLAALEIIVPSDRDIERLIRTKRPDRSPWGFSIRTAAAPTR
jgi:hypothetical protein